MTTINTIPLYSQALKISLNITSSFTTLINNIARGNYFISLAISNSFECSFYLFLSDTYAVCFGANNCAMKLEPFYNNTSDCGLYINNSYILRFRYQNSNFDVKNVQGGTLSICAFVIEYLGRDMPSNGTSIHAIDQIQASTGSIISFVNDITGGNSTFTNFINITSITGSFQLN